MAFLSQAGGPLSSTLDPQTGTKKSGASFDRIGAALMDAILGTDDGSPDIIITVPTVTLKAGHGAGALGSTVTVYAHTPYAVGHMAKWVYNMWHSKPRGVACAVQQKNVWKNE